MGGIQTARAWGAVHTTRPACYMMMVATVGSVMLGQSTITELGTIRLANPLAILLMLPAVTGLSAAVACVNNARLPLPDPPRAAVARLIWVASWTVIATLAANTAQAIDANAGWLPVARNVLLYCAIGLATIQLGFPQFIWLPALGYTFVCMYFGYPQFGGDFYWWAVVTQSDTTTAQMATVSAIYISAAIFYVLPGKLTMLRSTAPALFGSVRFGHGLLNAVDGEDVSSVVEVAAGVGDVRACCEAEGVEGQVAEAGNDPGSPRGRG
jgi:hypothetical protein